jgi:tetratricopeptide (TPR) repeat protein
MRKTLCLFILMCCTLLSYAQDVAKDSTVAANLLIEVRKLFFSDRVTALNKTLEALEIAEKIGNKPMQGTLNNIAGTLYSYQTKFDLSLNYLNRALEISNSTNDLSLKSKVLNNIGLNYLQQGNHLKSIEFGLKAVKIFETIKNYSMLGGTIPISAIVIII